MIDFSAPLAGLDRASGQLDRVAVAVSQAVDPQDSVDLSAEAVAMIQARNNFEINVKMLKVEDQIAKSTIELFG